VRDRPAKAERAGGGASDDEEAGGPGGAPDAPGDEETYYDAMKRDMAGREARTRAALDALAPEQRVAMEGFRPGAYLRLRFSGAPLTLTLNLLLPRPARRPLRLVALGAARVRRAHE
jgi:ribosome biogenesis protein BMS1